MAYNSDGYIMIDFAEVDFRKTNQTIDGLFDRCQKVIGTNKFVIVINANNKTPLPSTVCITNGQYVIESVLYTFAISSNDNLHITKKTTPEELIDDNHVTLKTTFSSSKINNLIDSNSVKRINGSLAIGVNTLVLSSENIVDNKAYYVGCDVYGVTPKNVVVDVEEHTITITYDEHATILNVEVLII